MKIKEIVETYGSYFTVCDHKAATKSEKKKYIFCLHLILKEIDIVY